MFGHQDEQQELQDQAAAVQADTSLNDPVTTTVTTNDQPVAADPVVTSDVPAVATTTTDDLLEIKRQALSDLSPLVNHLEQSPEDKFRTTMMMLQASDDQSLVRVAYEAAQQITDQKLKAQALLDVVNEINYFTHKGTDAA